MDACFNVVVRAIAHALNVNLTTTLSKKKPPETLLDDIDRLRVACRGYYLVRDMGMSITSLLGCLTVPQKIPTCASHISRRLEPRESRGRATNSRKGSMQPRSARAAE